MASILIVDDEAPMRRVLRRFLEGEGHEVSEAKNGVEALAALGEHSFALACVDLGMPVMDGFELLKRMNKEFPEVKAVSISTEVSVLDFADRESNVVTTVEKPFTKEEVLEAVGIALG